MASGRASLQDGLMTEIASPAPPSGLPRSEGQRPEALPLVPLLLASFAEGRIPPELEQLSGLDHGSAARVLESRRNRGAPPRMVPAAMRPKTLQHVDFGSQGVSFSNMRLSALFTFEFSIERVFRENAVHIPSLITGNAEIKASPIALDSKTIVLLCRELEQDLSYYVVCRVSNQIDVVAILSMDGCDCIYMTKKRSVEPLPLIMFVRRELANQFGRHGQAYIDWVNSDKNDMALVLFDASSAHLGHFIWNEMYAMESALNDGGAVPAIYAYNRDIKTEFFGPIEDIYPEFSGRIVRGLGTFSDACDHAIRHGRTLIHTSGKKALSASRNRLKAALANNADIALFRESFDALRRDPATGRARPIVVFSLRLQNRGLVDALAFYVEAALALERTFGSVAVLFDGLNTTLGAPSGQSLKLFIRRGSEDLDKARQNSPMERELELIEQFKIACEGHAITVKSLVGTTMPVNLAWLDISDFFVTFPGAALAKLRWALSKPGYVLTSAVNIRTCGHLHIYDDPHFMDAVPEPLFFNDESDVFDHFHDGFEERRTGIPHPVLFELADQSATISEIVQRVRETFEHR